MKFLMSENYQWMNELLDRPNPEIYLAYRTGLYTEKLNGIMGEIGYPEVLLKQIPTTFQDFESNYIELFDVGVPNPPYPLLETHYYTRDPAPAVIHENIMFYKAFGLELQSEKELPNHLIHQLEFLAYLTNLLENDNLNLSMEFKKGVLQAKIDYLSRHIFNWYPKMVQSMEENGLPEYYLPIFKCLLKLFEYDYEQTVDKIKELNILSHVPNPS